MKIINYIDSLLSKITMYRLVLYCLTALLGFAFIASFFGVFAFAPYALTYSFFILLITAWIANTLLGKFFNVPTNVESIYITVFILALIISPPRADQFVTILPLLLWASVLSMASKYILTIARKHIFNPAAIAVAITAVALGQSATWWVGTAWMLPLVIVTGLLITRKIQRFDLVISFVIAALISIILSTLTKSAPLITLEKTFVDSSLLFFAFIMLTEPLTAPPLRWQRIIYGVFVGALFAPQLHLGSIFSTPELALSVGNLLSYALSPKRKYILTLKSKSTIATDTDEFVFTPDAAVSFKPGQYMEWTVGHSPSDSRGNRRYFTLSSSPTEKEVRLGVKFYDNSSSFKKHLGTMKAGQTVLAGQLSGEFTLPTDATKKLAFVAGGIGITPFRSMIKFLLDSGESRDIVLLYSNKTQEEIAYMDIFGEAEKKFGMKIVHTLTEKSKLPQGWNGFSDFINTDMVTTAIPDFKDRIFYISGPHGMVSATEDVLKKLGVARTHIKKDFFPGLV